MSYEEILLTITKWQIYHGESFDDYYEHLFDKYCYGIDDATEFYDFLKHFLNLKDVNELKKKYNCEDQENIEFLSCHSIWEDLVLKKYKKQIDRNYEITTAIYSLYIYCFKQKEFEQQINEIISEDGFGFLNKETIYEIQDKHVFNKLILDYLLQTNQLQIETKPLVGYSEYKETYKNVFRVCKNEKNLVVEFDNINASVDGSLKVTHKSIISLSVLDYWAYCDQFGKFLYIEV